MVNINYSWKFLNKRPKSYVIKIFHKNGPLDLHFADTYGFLSKKLNKEKLTSLRQKIRDLRFLRGMCCTSVHVSKQEESAQGGRAQHDFSLAWLEAAWYSSGSGHGPTRNWRREAGVLKKLNLAGLAKLSRLR